MKWPAGKPPHPAGDLPEELNAKRVRGKFHPVQKNILVQLSGFPIFIQTIRYFYSVIDSKASVGLL